LKRCIYLLEQKDDITKLARFAQLGNRGAFLINAIVAVVILVVGFWASWNIKSILYSLLKE
ncbi:hypothetical protein NAI67_12130, partial [Francisella tularensis subsp. holarctica]|nr:hypothetical protein [Francisella tularensis subsp. holarctica]